jgi:hypothetical protein
MSNFLFDQISKNLSKIAIISIAGLFTLTGVPSAAKPMKIGTATTFDFKGCTKSSDGQDIICVGSFRNRDADQRAIVYKNSTFITDFEGKSYNPDELKISDKLCRRGCNQINITLAESVDYKTIFVFKDVSLPSPKIALLQIRYYLNYPGGDIKFRRITVDSNSSSVDNGEIVTPSLTAQEELRNAVNEVEKQDQERIATAQAEQLKKDREVLARKKKQSASVSKKPASSWLDQQVNQGILDLLGKPRKPGKK